MWNVELRTPKFLLTVLSVPLPSTFKIQNSTFQFQFQSRRSVCTTKMSNNECRTSNSEVFVDSFIGSNSFDIRHSKFKIRHSTFQFQLQSHRPVCTIKMSNNECRTPNSEVFADSFVGSNSFDIRHSKFDIRHFNSNHIDPYAPQKCRMSNVE
jgi:hypothetical protein